MPIRTRLATWVTCTCPYDQHRGLDSATCSHATAVLYALPDNEKLPVYMEN